eukprot:NODE_742_length_4285_cov_0.769470.p3 type:complete len:132 gc:universal NODE_742_length_4285_cov_0.769470:2165-1770(-)
MLILLLSILFAKESFTIRHNGPRVHEGEYFHCEDQTVDKALKNKTWKCEDSNTFGSYTENTYNYQNLLERWNTLKVANILYVNYDNNKILHLQSKLDPDSNESIIQQILRIQHDCRITEKEKMQQSANNIV